MKKLLPFISVLVVLSACSHSLSKKTPVEQNTSTAKESQRKDTFGIIKIQSHYSYDQALTYEPEENFHSDTIFASDIDTTTDPD